MPKHICMLAYPYDPKRVIFPTYIQPKLDGVRAIWKHKEKHFVSRNNKLLVIPSLLCIPLYSATFDLDGEITIPEKSFNEISRVVRHQDMIPEKVLLRYTIFDCMLDIPYEERYNKIHLFLISIASGNIIHLLTKNKVSTYKELLDLHEIILTRKYEGSIIRNNTPYEFKRSFNLLKLKPTKEITCKILGLIEGTGKYEGMLGALTVETPDKKVFNVGSGFTDEDRNYIWLKDVKHYENTFVKIKYQDLSEYGIPRFPIFKGFGE